MSNERGSTAGMRATALDPTTVRVDAADVRIRVCWLMSQFWRPVAVVLLALSVVACGGSGGEVSQDLCGQTVERSAGFTPVYDLTLPHTVPARIHTAPSVAQYLVFTHDCVHGVSPSASPSSCGGLHQVVHAEDGRTVAAAFVAHSSPCRSTILLSGRRVATVRVSVCSSAAGRVC